MAVANEPQEQNQDLKQVQEEKPSAQQRQTNLRNKQRLIEELNTGKSQKTLQKLAQIKEEKELEGCTFKPKINKVVPVNYPNDITVYEKLSKPSLDRERLKVYENVKTIIEMKECTFKPKVNKTAG